MDALKASIEVVKRKQLSIQKSSSLMQMKHKLKEA
jgi:hypothetical protein